MPISPLTRSRPFLAGALALVLAASASAAAEAGVSGRPFVVNGENAEEGRYPFMVSLQLKELEAPAPERHFCGGTLVDAEWVLTAAHCTEFLRPEDVSVVIGRTRLSGEGGHVRDVAEIVVHPEWNPETISADVALVKLSAPVTGVVPIEPVRPEERALWEPGDPATTIGWGVRSEEEDATVPDHLQTVDLPIQSDATMTSPDVYGGDFRPEDMLGAGPIDGGAGSCFGDSGGPLMVSDGGGLRQIGVVSWGRECAGDSSPGVYARVGEGRIRAFLDAHIPLRVRDVRAAERGAAAFVIALARPSTLPVALTYTTVAVTATSGTDFAPMAGTLTIAAGSTQATVTVPVAEDVIPERDETLRLTVTSAANALVADGSAVATILDDDLQ